MHIDRFRQMLQEFARQSRQGRVATRPGDGTRVADLADQLDRELGGIVNQRMIKSDTISFAPAKCPCCGN